MNKAKINEKGYVRYRKCGRWKKFICPFTNHSVECGNWCNIIRDLTYGDSDYGICCTVVKAIRNLLEDD